MASESSSSAQDVAKAVVAPVIAVQKPNGASAGQAVAGVPPSKPKFVGNYELQQTIGEGSFAKVKQAVHRLTRQKVAIKIIDKTKLPDEYSLKNIHREAHIMRMIDHPNIIQLFEVMETKKNLFLVLEYATGGELLEYIVSNGRLKEEEAKKFVLQVLSALEYAHSLNVAHRDLKAENLLLDEHLNIKISDFGLSNVFDPASYLSTSCGSPVYSAPELIEGKKYIGPEVDAWSLGINVYAMVVGDLPFADANLTALYESILRGKYDIPDYVSADCKDFIAKLLVVNPKKRATVAQMREHPWLHDGTSFLEPISMKKEGGFRPRTEAQIDVAILDQLEQMGFERAATIQAVITGKFNQAAGTYYLLAHEKRQIIANGGDGSSLRVGQRAARLAGDDGRVGEEGFDEEGSAARGSHVQQDITSDELARVLFQVEGIRGAAAPAAPGAKENREGVATKARDSHAGRNERKSTFGNSQNPTNATNQPSGKATTLDPDPSKTGKPIIKRVRARGAGAASQAGAAASGQQPAIGQTTGLQPSSFRDTDDDARSSESRSSILPRITQSRAGRQFESKVVNLPNINAQSSQSGGSDQNQSSLKTSHIPVMDLTGGAGGNSDRGTSPKVHARRLNKNAPIPVDESLYLTKDQESEAGDPPPPPGPMGVPRTIRFAFNCTATTTLLPEVLFERLRLAFDHNDVAWRNEGFLCECEWGDIKLEVEVCKLPRIRSYGVRLKRINGDIWEYKKLCGKLTNDLDVNRIE